MNDADAMTYSIEDLRKGEREARAYAEAARALVALHQEYAKNLVGTEKAVAVAMADAHKLMVLGADALVAHYRKAIDACL